MKTITDLREWHELLGRSTLVAGQVHREAISIIDRLRAGHKHVVEMLMDRLARQAARLRTSTEVLTSEVERHMATLEAEQARAAVLEEELAAEREITAALNDRLVEFERGGEGERAEAWRAVTQALNEVCPDWAKADLCGQDCAVAAIRSLAGRAAAGPALEPEQGQQGMTPEGAFLRDVGHECRRARAKHPGTEAMGNALAEETGEVAQALADEPAEHVYKECVQVASTAMRIALEGDRAVDFIRARRGLDALPGSPFVGFGWDNVKTPHDLRAALAARLTIHLTDKHGMPGAGALAHDLAGEVVATFGKHLAEHGPSRDLPHHQA